MFKKAKQKIVLSILAILATVLVGTLGMIYITSYLSATAQNYQVLERQMENLLRDSIADEMGPQDNKLPKDKQSNSQDSGQGNSQNDSQNNSQDDGQKNGQNGLAGKRGLERIQRNLKVGVFYELRIPENGTPEVIQNAADGLYSDEELIAYAQKVSDRSKGRIDDLLYLVDEKDGVTFVCFMDNTIFSESFTRLFLFTLIFGLIAMIAIAWISVNIANRIVSPMEESYQKQKQFTADAGHELKTPVAVVAANLELLQREIGENKWLENINYENERMRVLITQLLELARNENQEMERTSTDLSHLVRGAILPHEASAFEKNILIEEDIAEGIMANVNEKSMEQFVSILLDNAISHCICKENEFAKVTVRLFSSKGTAVLSVTNPGDEIPEKERDKLFERFYRSDQSREYTGHYGLGLAIAKSIADANHGKIEVSCQDGMVTFYGRFPQL